MTPWLLACCSLYSSALATLFIPVLRRESPWLGHALFVVAVVIALASGWLSWLALLWLALLVGGSRLFHQTATPAWLKGVALVVVTIVTLGLAAHVMPGFANPVLDVNSVAGAGQPHHINLDKAFAGYLLLAFWVLRSPVAVAGNSWRWVGVFLATPLLVFPLGMVLGLVSPDVKLPDYTLLWAWSNLFITCVTEEAFFRGLIQQQLVQRLNRHGFGVATALVFTSVLFGLVHFGSGAAFVVVAGVAGLGYGLAYHLSGRIELAILLHFTINLIHFLLFTYPAAR